MCTFAVIDLNFIYIMSGIDDMQYFCPVCFLIIQNVERSITLQRTENCYCINAGSAYHAVKIWTRFRACAQHTHYTDYRVQTIYSLYHLWYCRVITYSIVKYVILVDKVRVYPRAWPFNSLKLLLGALSCIIVSFVIELVIVSIKLLLGDQYRELFN